MAKLFGGLMIAIGILIAGASGLCTVSFGLTSWPLHGGTLLFLLFFGGMPFALGIGAIFSGWTILRADRQNEPPPPPA